MTVAFVKSINSKLTPLKRRLVSRLSTPYVTLILLSSFSESLGASSKSPNSSPDFEDDNPITL